MSRINLTETANALIAMIAAHIHEHCPRTYHGERVPNADEESITTATNAIFTVRFPRAEALTLSPRLDLRNHSPSGMNWGYGGSGPSQLALAILADFTGSADFALRNYQDAKHEFIAGNRQSLFQLNSDRLLHWVKPRIRRFVEEQLSDIFEPTGELKPSASVNVQRDSTISLFFETAEDGSIELVDYRDTETIRQRIPDFVQFFFDEVFLGKSAPTRA